jgi:hypothetical protein
MILSYSIHSTIAGSVFSDLKIPSVVPRATEKRPSKDTIEVVPLDIHYYYLVMTNSHGKSPFLIGKPR